MFAPCVSRTSLAVGALVSLGVAVAVGGEGAGVWCGAGAAAVLLLDRRRVRDGALVAVVV